MKYLLIMLIIPLIASENKSSPIPIPQKKIYQQAKEKVRKERLDQMHELNKKPVAVDDLKKSSRMITECNKKNIYDNPEFTGKKKDDE